MQAEASGGERSEQPSEAGNDYTARAGGHRVRCENDVDYEPRESNSLPQLC